MVKAGDPTDAVIDELVPLLEEGDIVVDGGNAHFEDTRRRETALREHGLHFVGIGISGGEVGALEGPSIMPGGSKESYDALGPLLESISANVDGEPCCAWMGPDGAGHFVKMVHNGIEYADMQFIAEAYDLLRGAGLTAAESPTCSASGTPGDLDSFLVEITAEVLRPGRRRHRSPAGGRHRRPGRAEGHRPLDGADRPRAGRPGAAIAESVFARSASGDIAIRERGRPASSPGRSDRSPSTTATGWSTTCATRCGRRKVVAYAQGLEHDPPGERELRLGRRRRHGRPDLARRLHHPRAAAGPDQRRVRGRARHLLVAPSIATGLGERQDAWRRVVAAAATRGVPVPGFSRPLAYYDTVRAERLPAALVQGLRDNFGAHTYQRTDRDGTFHTLWSGDRTEIDADAHPKPREAGA